MKLSFDDLFGAVGAVIALVVMAYAITAPEVTHAPRWHGPDGTAVLEEAQPPPNPTLAGWRGRAYHPPAP